MIKAERRIMRRELREGSLIKLPVRSKNGRGVVTNPRTGKPATRIHRLMEPTYTPWVWRTRGAQLAAVAKGKSKVVARAKALAAL